MLQLAKFYKGAEMLKSDFLKRLNDLGLSVNDFANLTKLSAGSIYNWNDEKKPIPSWVEPFLMCYEKSTRYEKIKELTKDL